MVRSLATFLILLFSLFPATHAADAPVGAIRGNVYDKDFADPIANVTISIQEANLSALSSPEGKFTFPQVPPGTYTLTFSKDGYQRRFVPDVVVNAGEFAEVRVDMTSEIEEMEEMVVTGDDLLGSSTEQLLEIRQESVRSVDSIGADLIKKSGASTAAAVLKLVPGTSVVDGKYVVVRGLADRYTSTLLNDVRLPTSDADKRAVQLDQFPGPMIESITVSKTFTPDLQGDSTGGSVNIKTRSIPDQRIFTMSGAAEYNTKATFNDKFLSYQSGGVNPFGIDDGSRDLPVESSRVPNYSGASTDPGEGNAGYPNALHLDQLTRSFSSTIGTSETGAPGPNYSWGMVAGDRFNLSSESRLGLLGTVSYRQKYSFYDDGVRRIASGTSGRQPITVSDDFDDARGVDEVLWGATAGVGYQINDDHLLSLTLVRNQVVTDEARLLIDSTLPSDTHVNQTIRYNDRTLSSAQLRGEHKLPELANAKIDWTASYSIADQNEPDQRFFRNNLDQDSGLQSASGPDLQHVLRIWREIEETSKQAQLNLTIPFKQWTGTEGFFKCGPFWDHTERDFNQNSFTYLFAGQAGSGPPVTQNSGLQNFFGSGSWSDFFLDPDRIGLAKNNPPAINQLLWYIQPSGVDVDYRGEQIIHAVYGMVELPLWDQFKLIGGARIEVTDLSIDVHSPLNNVQVIRQSDQGNFFLQDVPDKEAGGKLNQIDVLPSLGAVYEVIPHLNLRASWAQTIARPTFRELAPVRTFEFLGGDTFIGNADLQMSKIDNYDFRAEWFRRPGDVLAASVFYKEIQDPIEQITLTISGNRFSQRVNYPEGKLYGLELEARQRLDILADWLKYFTIGANASYIHSEVTLPKSERVKLRSIDVNTKTRPLQGQPEYILNANLSYENPRSGTTAGIFYTLTGRSLVSGESVSDNFIPSLYEMPVDNLDFSIEQRLGLGWRIIFRAKNITDPLIRRAYAVKSEDTTTTQSAFRRGIDFSIGASWSW